MNPESITSVVDLILQGGAVVALVWVVVLLTTGKLHTSSEVEGLRRDKADLLVVNSHLSGALEQSNELLRLAITRRGDR